MQNTCNYWSDSLMNQENYTMSMALLTRAENFNGSPIFKYKQGHNTLLCDSSSPTWVKTKQSLDTLVCHLPALNLLEERMDWSQLTTHHTLYPRCHPSAIPSMMSQQTQNKQHRQVIHLQDHWWQCWHTQKSRHSPTLLPILQSIFRSCFTWIPIIMYMGPRNRAQTKCTGSAPR